jgi:hypothetical protein
MKKLRQQEIVKNKILQFKFYLKREENENQGINY